MLDEKLGVGDFIYDPQIYDKVNQFENDIKFYYDIASNVKGKVLELCCGTGRITIPLKEKGIDILGIDFTKPMLERAKEKAKNKQLQIDFMLEDMRTFNLNKKFSMIFIPFNSLQNTYSNEDLSKVFQSVANHLEDDGIFVFDIFSPNIHLLVNGEERYRIINKFTIDSGEEVIVSEKGKYDSATQTFRLNWKHKIGNIVKNQKLDMRCFYPLEMDLHIKYNNFKIIEKFGDFDLNKFSSDSKKMIYICKIDKAKK